MSRIALSRAALDSRIVTVHKLYSRASWAYKTWKGEMARIAAAIRPMLVGNLAADGATDGVTDVVDGVVDGVTDVVDGVVGWVADGVADVRDGGD